eukprot:3612992-Amphidinium_carterae.1
MARESVLGSLSHKNAQAGMAERPMGTLSTLARAVIIRPWPCGFKFEPSVRGGRLYDQNAAHIDHTDCVASADYPGVPLVGH